MFFIAKKAPSRFRRPALNQKTKSKRFKKAAVCLTVRSFN